MADVTMFIKIDGTDAEDAVPIMQDNARVLADWLRDAGHALATVKVAIVCQACDQLLNPGKGTLCNSCAREEALERQMQEVKEATLPMLPSAMPLQPAEVMY